jgi:hypothetical protein
VVESWVGLPMSGARQPGARVAGQPGGAQLSRACFGPDQASLALVNQNRCHASFDKLGSHCCAPNCPPPPTHPSGFARRSASRHLGPPV